MALTEIIVYKTGTEDYYKRSDHIFPSFHATLRSHAVMIDLERVEAVSVNSAAFEHYVTKTEVVKEERWWRDELRVTEPKLVSSTPLRKVRLVSGTTYLVSIDTAESIVDCLGVRVLS